MPWAMTRWRRLQPLPPRTPGSRRPRPGGRTWNRPGSWRTCSSRWLRAMTSLRPPRRRTSASPKRSTSESRRRDGTRPGPAPAAPVPHELKAHDGHLHSNAPGAGGHRFRPAARALPLAAAARYGPVRLPAAPAGSDHAGHLHGLPAGEDVSLLLPGLHPQERLQPRSAGGLRGPGQLPRDPQRRDLLVRAGPFGGPVRGTGHPDDEPGHVDRAADEPATHQPAGAGEHRPAAGLGHAATDLDGGVGLDVRLPVRRGQLPAGAAGLRTVLPALLAV